MEAVMGLIRENEGYLRGLTRKYSRTDEDADDAWQEITLKILKSFNQLRDPHKFRSWAASICVNSCQNRRRGRRNHTPHVGEEVILTLASKEPGIDEQVHQKRQMEIIKEVADTLPPRQQRAFKLRYFDGMAYKDISEIMNQPYDTAKANARHGLMKIKKLLSA